MTLPSIGTSVNTQDTNKQLSQIRSYLNQLKDELEAELMNVGYDNLTADLKNRLSTMSNDIQVQGEEIASNFEYVTANTISAATIAAEYVKATELNAKVANLGYVTSSYVETNYLTANYLFAIDGFVNKLQTTELNAKYITSGTVAAARISSAIMRTSAFTAQNICGLINAPDNGLTITTETLRAQHYSYYTDLTGSGAQYYPLTLKTFTVNGTQYRCLGV